MASQVSLLKSILENPFRFFGLAVGFTCIMIVHQMIRERSVRVPFFGLGRGVFTYPIGSESNIVSDNIVIRHDN